MGSTRPSPVLPRPVPSFQPMIFSNLLPTLFWSWPGFTGGGGGGSGGGGPSAWLFLPGLLLSIAGIGTSGWLCITRRSEARSRYFGNSDGFEASVCRAASAFCRATSRRLASLKFFYLSNQVGRSTNAMKKNKHELNKPRRDK